MRNKYTIFLTSLMMLIFFSTNFLFAEIDEDEIREKLPLIAGSSNVGKEYVFSIPPIYESTPGNNFVKIFITSGIATKVQIEIPKYNKTINGLTIPNDVIGFDMSPTETMPFSWTDGQTSSKPCQVWPGAGVRISAEDPIVVYVMVKYRWTSDGFLALPISGLGREYIVANYNDMGWGGNQFFPPWGVITAAYDNTDFNITMGGNASSAAKLESGALIKPGQKIPKFRMQKSDVYVLTSNGPFQDISGSKIVANKPFSLVSGHFCTNIPVSNQWCDYTVDMQFPTSTWGKLYHIPSYTPRRYPGIIRVFAKEDNTNVFRDGQFWFNIKKGGGLEGDGWQEHRVWPRLKDNGQDQGPKNAVISSDKPIGITYYNPGTQEDAGLVAQADSDPFTMTMSPVEQYQGEITFCTPAVKGGDRFGRNFINVVYELNESGFMPDDFEFAEVKGGRFEWKAFNDVFGGSGNQFVGGVSNGVFDVNGKKYGSKQVLLGGDGVYKLRHKSGKFACYSYGFNDYESYGYPTSAALNDLTIPDTVAPDPKWEQDCFGNVENGKGSVTDRPDNPALRSNLNYIAIDNNTSYNYKFEFNPIEGGTTITTSWKLTVVDPLKDARADLIFIDRAGNDTVITINYSAVKYEITADHNYGQFQLGESGKHEYTIKNLSETKPLLFKDLKLKYGNQGFSIDLPLSWDINQPVEPLGTRKVTVTFTADANLPKDKSTFMDSLGIGYECGFGNFVKLEASTGAPTIRVEDHNYGKVNINVVQGIEKTINVRNDGNARLTITGYSALTETVFTTDLTKSDFANVSVANPVIIEPNGTKSFKVYFKPTASIKYTDRIVFTANTDQPDPICELTGEGIEALLSVNGNDWASQRIDRPGFTIAPTPDLTWNDGSTKLTLKNSGTAPITITNITLAGTATDENSFIFADGKPLNQANLNAIFANKQVPAGGELTADVLYHPKVAGSHRLEITFNNSENIADVKSVLTGIGTEPFIAVTTPIDFLPMIFGDPILPAPQMIKIMNTSTTNGDVLTITDIVSSQTNGVDDVSKDKNAWGVKGFRYDGTNPDLQLPIKLAPGASIEFPVEFNAPTKVGPFQGRLTFVSDATVNAQTVNVTVINGDVVNQGINRTAKGDVVCKGATPDVYVTIVNNGDTDINVNDVSVTNTANGTVTLADNNDKSFLLPANKIPRTIKLNFNTSTAMNPTDFEVTFKTNAIDDSLKTITVSDKVGVYDFVVNSSSRITQKVSVGDNLTYTVKIDGGVNSSNAGLNKFDVEIVYPSYIVNPILNQIKIADNYKTNWKIDNISAPVVVDAKDLISKIVVSISGDSSAIVFDNLAGDLLDVTFKVSFPVYNDQTATARGDKFEISHNFIETVSNDCIAFENNKNESELIPVCADNLRDVVITGTPFGLSAINPNPVGNSGADINFSVGFECPTTIKIYSVEGAVVSELVNNESMPAGKYSVKIPIEKLSNGVYMYEMISGPYSSVEKLVIQK